MNKIVYIIPGFGQQTKMSGYNKLLKFFKTKKFKVVSVKISWKNKVMSNYIDEFSKQLTHQKEDEVYLFGFSLGAMIAFISAEKINPKVLLLASLSPYFKEDLKFVRESWKNFLGKKRIEDFKNFSFTKLAKKIDCKTFLFAGETEVKELFRRVEDANKNLKHSELFIIKNTKHDISQKEYLNKLEEIINTL
ncbi:MAG: hypothetical protein WC025_02960 [Candidatus Magasanikbacteria bacterium]